MAPQGQQASKDDAAIPTEHHRKIAGLQDLADRIGKLARVFGDALRIEHQCFGIATVVVRRWLDARGPASPQLRVQSCSHQRVRQSLDPGRPKPEHGWRFDNRILARHYFNSSSTDGSASLQPADCVGTAPHGDYVSRPASAVKLWSYLFLR